MGMRLNEQGELREELMLHDLRVPSGAALTSRASLGELPLVLDFQLRMPQLGFVMRLQQRFGCAVPEVLYSCLRALLEYVDNWSDSLLPQPGSKMRPLQPE